MRKFLKNTTLTKSGPRANGDIRSPRVQLINAEGNNVGELSIEEALSLAEEEGLDLVEISPNSVPPVVKILDLGKLKYISQKKAAEVRKNQKVVDIKEINIRPNIKAHDYEVKMKTARRFFEAGDKVKLTLRFRGREVTRVDLGVKLLEKAKEELMPIAKIESEVKLEGRQMMMIFSPK